MRIQEVMGKTGLSRRTIHYYIDQKLIIPPVNEGNGYHDFTEEDVQKLFIIRKLREAGLSLADIRAILRKPRTTPFYLHKQMNELQTQMLTIQKTISEMDRLSGQLPVCQSLDQLAGMLEDTNFSPDEPPQFQMESRDARAAGAVSLDGLSGHAGHGVSAVSVAENHAADNGTCADRSENDVPLSAVYFPGAD